jgi:hypothetical protein
MFPLSPRVTQHKPNQNMTTSFIQTPDQDQKIKSSLIGKKVTGVSASNGQQIYGEVVNVRFCLSGILVDIQNGEWVRNSYIQNVEVYAS